MAHQHLHAFYTAPGTVVSPTHAHHPRDGISDLPWDALIAAHFASGMVSHEAGTNDPDGLFHLTSNKSSPLWYDIQPSGGGMFSHDDPFQWEKTLTGVDPLSMGLDDDISCLLSFINETEPLGHEASLDSEPHSSATAPFLIQLHGTEDSPRSEPSDVSAAEPSEASLSTVPTRLYYVRRIDKVYHYTCRHPNCMHPHALKGFRNYTRHISTVHGKSEHKAVKKNRLKLAQAVALNDRHCYVQRAECIDEDCWYYRKYNTRWFDQRWKREDNVFSEHMKTHKDGEPRFPNLLVTVLNLKTANRPRSEPKQKPDYGRLHRPPGPPKRTALENQCQEDQGMAHKPPSDLEKDRAKPAVMQPLITPESLGFFPLSPLSSPHELGSTTVRNGSEAVAQSHATRATPYPPLPSRSGRLAMKRKREKEVTEAASIEPLFPQTPHPPYHTPSTLQTGPVAHSACSGNGPPPPKRHKRS